MLQLTVIKISRMVRTTGGQRIIVGITMMILNNILQMKTLNY